MKDFIPSVEQLETTNRVYALRRTSKNDNDLSRKLGISKVTLYTRLGVSNWKLAQVYHVTLLTAIESIKTEIEVSTNKQYIKGLKKSLSFLDS